MRLLVGFAALVFVSSAALAAGLERVPAIVVIASDPLSLPVFELGKGGRICGPFTARASDGRELLRVDHGACIPSEDHK
jgi:hypothetical protein